MALKLFAAALCQHCDPQTGIQFSQHANLATDKCDFKNKKVTNK